MKQYMLRLCISRDRERVSEKLKSLDTIHVITIIYKVLFPISSLFSQIPYDVICKFPFGLVAQSLEQL